MREREREREREAFYFISPTLERYLPCPININRNE